MAGSKGSRETEEAVTEVGGGLDTTLHSEPGDIADPDAEIPSFTAGQRYEVQRSLGEGGMGEVRLCRDRVIGREVALKAVLPAHAGRAEIRARFVREARVQGQLEHPAIVPVYDFGADDEGRPFFTMKRVRGVTLETVIESLRRDDKAMARRYTTHKLLGVFVQVCLAMDFAHERGVLHRDLKPANIMLGGYGEVYVLDWGVARVRSASRTLETTAIAVVGPDEKPAATKAGAIIGTPGYMAPEQLRGDQLDERTDVYALGAILFELLTLEPLHGGGSLTAMMKRALEGADARPSVRAPEREVAPELEAVCVRACSRDPAQRHASARELSDAVEAFLSGDRDLELRRALAKVHLDRARDARARAMVPDAPATERTEALREIGHAVALDPTDATALELLVEMLTTPPKEAPPEVHRAVEASRLESQRRMLPRIATIYAVSALACVPLQVYLGIRDIRLVMLPITLWMLLSFAVLAMHRYFSTGQRLLPYLGIGGAIAIAASSVLFGPLLLGPTAAVMLSMGTILVSRPGRRRTVIISNALALLVPIAMAWLDIHPVTHVVEGDHTLRIGFAAIGITRDGAFAILSAVYVLLLVVGARFAALYRDALTAADTKNELQAWQLRQLMPAEATRALGGPKSS